MIIGAGIGGLTAALALQRAGFKVSVYEQAAELGEAGAGLTIAPNGMHVLNHLGLGKAMKTIAMTPRHGAVMHYKTGRVLVDIPRGDTQVEKYGAPYCQVHRADLHAALVDAVAANDPQCIHTAYTLTDFSDSGEAITADFENGVSVIADVLIGCDGIRSVVRSELFGKEEPRFTGYIAWRGMVPMANLPQELTGPDSAIWLGPGHFLTRYRVRNGALLNYVAVAACDGWQEEGWSVAAEVSEVVETFRDFEPNARRILEATPPDHCHKWGIFDRDPLPVWGHGRVTLLGDAAHPTSPFLGQGAVMAMEDALVLARSFELSESLATTLQRYEDARRERGAFVILESRSNLKLITECNPDTFGSDIHRNEESLGLADYDAVTVAI